MSEYWTEDRKQRVVDYMSGMIFGYCIGILLTVDILINYYNQLVREKVETVMPRLGAWLGR